MTSFRREKCSLTGRASPLRNAPVLGDRHRQRHRIRQPQLLLPRQSAGAHHAGSERGRSPNSGRPHEAREHLIAARATAARSVDSSILDELGSMWGCEMMKMARHLDGPAGVAARMTGGSSNVGNAGVVASPLGAERRCRWIQSRLEWHLGVQPLRRPERVEVAIRCENVRRSGKVASATARQRRRPAC